MQTIDVRTLIFAFDDVSRQKLDATGLAYQSPDFSALETISATSCIILIIACDEMTVAVKQCVELCLQHQGHFPKLIAVAHNNPTEELMNQLYEFDVDYFISYENLVTSLDQVCESVRDDMNRQAHPLRAVKLAYQSLIGEGQKQIASAAEFLLPHAQYSCDAAFALGKTYEAMGDFVAAIAAYRQALAMQPKHRLAMMSLAECLLIQQKGEEALALLLDMERLNARHPARKALLTAVYADLKDLNRAHACVDEAVIADPESARTREAQAHIFIAEGYLQEALDLVSSLGEIGSFLTAKLNEVGIKLSQSGKGSEALLLYTEAHKIVRHDLRFKISMNAALAAHRNNQPDLALKLLQRCEQEYGGKFAKLEKIRAVVEQALQQRTSSAKKVAS